MPIAPRSLLIYPESLPAPQFHVILELWPLYLSEAYQSTKGPWNLLELDDPKLEAKVENVLLTNS